MNIFHKVTLETLRKNRVRTLVTIIGIILSAAMICAVTTFASSILNFLREDVIYDKGDYYGKTFNITLDTIQELKKDKRLSQLATSQRVGYAYLEGCTNEYKPYLYIMGADEAFLDSMPVHLTSGSLPKSSSEILIPDHVKSNGGVEFSIGDTITLELGQRISDGSPLYQNTALTTGDDGKVYEHLKVSEIRTYTVTGFYERPGFEDYSAPGYTAITVMDENASGTYSYDIYYKTKNSKDIYSFMEDHNLGRSTNWSLLAYSGASRYDGFYSVMSGLGSIFIALIMFGSIALIYNAFAISVSERTKQFGLLVSIGATRRQIRGSVLFEALVLSLVGIPLGILSGIGGIGITLYLLRDKLPSITGSQIPVTVCISWVSVASAVIIAIITVLISAWIPSRRAVRITAIDAIRQSRDISARPGKVRTSPLTYKLFGLEGMIAAKYFKRSKKRYKATIVSLFMSIVLFISTGSFCMYLTESIEGAMDTYGFDIAYYYNQGESTSFKQTFDELSSVKGVTKAAYTSSDVIGWEIPTKNYSQDYLDFVKSYGEKYYTSIMSGETPVSYDIYFIEDSVYEDFLNEKKLAIDKFMDTSSPVALVYDKISIFDTNVGRYRNIHLLENTGKDIYICEPKPYNGYTFDRYDTSSDGTKVMIYVNDDTGEEKQLPQDEYLTKTKAEIGGITDALPFCVEGDSSYRMIFMYPYSAINKVMGKDYDSYSPIFYFTASNHSTVYDEMKTLLEENNIENLKYKLQDYAAESDDQRNLVTVIRVFAYGFITLISLIALANVFNTITTNIALRRREFAMLRSVGMTSKGFNRMVNFECIIYGLRSLAAGLPVSVGVTYLIYKSVDAGYETDFHMSWLSIGVAIFSVFAVVYATMMYAMGRIKKDNPIDALRNENL